MLLTFLVDSAGGGASRLGGIVKQGLRIVRQVLHGDKPGLVQGPEHGVAKLPQILPSALVPAARSNILSVVRRGARGILSNYLARNQIDSLAAQMRRRYALRLMSGSGPIYAGLRNRIALFGFVGVSFGGAVHNHAYTRENNGSDIQERLIHDLFEFKPEVVAVSKILPTEEDNAEFLFARRQSLSEDSDITLLSDTESDFEVIQLEDFEAVQLDRSENKDKEVTTIRDIVKSEAMHNAELGGLVRQLGQQNTLLEELLHLQTLEDNKLKRELSSALEAMEAQQKELLMLHNVVLQQRTLLESILGQPETTRVKNLPPLKDSGSKLGLGRNPNKIVYARPSSSSVNTSVQMEVGGERLRSPGGRVRDLKIHRKHWLKNS